MALKDPAKIAAKIAQDKAKYEALVAQEAQKHGIVHDTLLPLVGIKHAIGEKINDLTGVNSDTPLTGPAPSDLTPRPRLQSS